MRAASLLLIVLLLSSCLTLTPSPSESAPPETGDTEAIENRVLSTVNAFRDSKGLGTLTAHTDMTALARAHSMHMATSNKLSHDGFDDRLDYLRAAFLSAVSENVASSRGHQDVAGTAGDNWRENRGHHRNMTNAKDTMAGVGVAYSNDGTGYVTMLYARQ